MKKSLKKPMIVFFVLNLVFFVASFVVLALQYFLIDYGTKVSFKTFLGTYLGGNASSSTGIVRNGIVSTIVDNLYYTKQGGKFYIFPQGFIPSHGEYFWTTYVAIVVAALALVGFIVGMILTIKRKRANYIPWVIMLVASCVPVLIFANRPEFIFSFIKDPNLFKNSLVWCIFSIGWVACGLLTYVFAFFTYFYGLAHAKRRLEANQVVEEVEAPVEEEVEEEKPLFEEEPEVIEAEDEQQAFATLAENADEKVESEPAVDTEALKTYEPMADFMTEPSEIPAESEEIVVEEIPQEEEVRPEPAPALDAASLAAMIKDVVRDIVKDELARSNASRAEEEHRPHACSQPSITGATFGGPLVVQYFNGGINSPQPAPAPVPAPAPAPVEEPKKEEPKPEPAPAPAPVEEPKKEEPKKEEPKPTPVPVPPADEEENDEKIKIVRIPFEERIVAADKSMQENYNIIKNEILSWGVKSRISNSGDTFRLHTKTYVKVTVAGKSLKLYFALDPKDYAESTIPVQDASDKEIYKEIPLVFKVKSDLSVRRAKELIQSCMEKDGLEQGEIASTNWVKEIKAEMKKA